MAREIDTQLDKYLTDAHAIEEQALAQLRGAPEIAGDSAIADAFRRHLTETAGHEETIRHLLEERGAAPSRVEDTLMEAGGRGVLLFAKLNPDTPAKLVEHSISYEALEQAVYELLHQVADRAGADDVALAATRIGNEERAMRERLEDLVDVAVVRSLRSHLGEDLREQLCDNLEDAHAIEEQSIELLERAPAIVGDSELARLFEEHLTETREQAEIVRARLKALGGNPSRLREAALRLGGFNWELFFRAQPDTPGKLAAFAYALENLEIAVYEELQRVAERALEDDTVTAVAAILEQERAAAARVWAMFDRAADASLAQAGVTA
jgi:ferritin-like metal-binding protein YciE